MKKSNGCNMSGKRRNERSKRELRVQGGFTLVEVLISLAILGLISLFIYETFIATARVTEKINQTRDDYRDIRLTADQLTRELLSAYRSSYSSTPLDFSGIHGTGPEGSMDTLSFYTMAHLHLIPNQPDTDLTKVSYYLEKPLNARWYQLSHEESPHFLSNGPPEKEVLVEKVKELSFQYFDGKTWLPEWDSGKSGNSIPTSVKVRFVMINQNGNEEEWVHQVNLFDLSMN